ncbi:MAG: hypothetical protein ABIG64_07075 [Candidatus Omnitrophota bacterium]
MKKKIIIFLVVSCFFYCSAKIILAKTAEEKVFADLRAFVNKATVTIAEPIRFTIEIDTDESLVVEFPYAGNNLGGFVVKDFGRDEPKKIGDQKLRRQQWYLLDTYTTGAYVIPEQEVRVKFADGTVKILKTAKIFVEVKSVLTEGDDQGLRDIKSPLVIKSQLAGIGVLILIILIAIGAGLAWAKYKNKFLSPQITAPDPAHVTALKQLAAIQAMHLITAGKIKEYYYKVNNCLRSYLENRFALKAPEQTTEEFLAFVATTNILNTTQIGILKEYLMHCDLVKYAKLIPGDNDPEKLMQTTREFIEQTKEADTGNDGQVHKKG